MEGKRPGGLTALAVINLVWGALTALGTLGMLAMPTIMQKVAEAGDEEAKAGAVKAQQAFADMGAFWYVLIAVGFVSALLLLCSGIGYLKQQRFLGRTLGNVWAILSILSSTVGAFVVAHEVGGGFQLGTIIGLVYPVLTLVLLNGTFKEDFVR